MLPDGRMVWKEFGQLEEMAVKALGILINHLWVFGCFIICLCQHAYFLGQTSLILLEFPQWGLARRKWDLFSLTMCPLFNHKTSQQFILPYTTPSGLHARHFCVNRVSFCAQESITWGLHVSSLKAMSRLSCSALNRVALNAEMGCISPKYKGNLLLVSEVLRLSIAVWLWRLLLHLAQQN